MALCDGTGTRDWPLPGPIPARSWPLIPSPAGDPNSEIVEHLLARTPSPCTRHPCPSPTGSAADFDEKDTHRRVEEAIEAAGAIPLRPLGAAPRAQLRV